MKKYKIKIVPSKFSVTAEVLVDDTVDIEEYVRMNLRRIADSGVQKTGWKNASITCKEVELDGYEKLEAEVGIRFVVCSDCEHCCCEERFCGHYFGGCSPDEYAADCGHFDETIKVFRIGLAYEEEGYETGILVVKEREDASPAKAVSCIIENKLPGYEELLEDLEEIRGFAKEDGVDYDEWFAAGCRFMEK